MHVSRLAVPAAAFGTLLASLQAGVAQQSERYTIAGDNIAIYNLVGVMRVAAGSGSEVVVELTRGGADAGRLRVERGAIRGRETLRVIYPDDAIVYRDEHGGSTSLEVRDDGTFGDSHGRHGSGGRRVRISGSGRGLEARADLRVAIPAGKRVALYLAVGQAFVANVNADLRVDVAAANVTADHTQGSLDIDTGSGDVRVSDAEGDVTLDTGSGNVIVRGVRGGAVNLDTGSGNVSAERITADALNVDTGSGDVTASGIQSGDVTVDTGSGSVRLDLLSDIASLAVDTGSGDVTIRIPADFGAQVDIETGSGGIELRGVTLRTTRLQSDHLVGEIGDGRGAVRISTGSGGVTFQRN